MIAAVWPGDQSTIHAILALEFPLVKKILNSTGKFMIMVWMTWNESFISDRPLKIDASFLKLLRSIQAFSKVPSAALPSFCFLLTIYLLAFSDHSKKAYADNSASPKRIWLKRCMSISPLTYNSMGKYLDCHFQYFDRRDFLLAKQTVFSVTVNGLHP